MPAAEFLVKYSPLWAYSFFLSGENNDAMLSLGICCYYYVHGWCDSAEPTKFLFKLPR